MGDFLLTKMGGAGDKTRTYDPLITNEMLYQLSYTGVATHTLHNNISFFKHFDCRTPNFFPHFANFADTHT